jgi:hypothetical protein
MIHSLYKILKRFSLWTWSFIVGLVLIIIILYSLYIDKDNFTILNNGLTIKKTCLWDKNKDPVIYKLKTKMGVNYKADHWFHMSENFMTSHSILRQQNRLSNSNHVIYNFDKDNFISDLKGVTKLMIMLGTININNKISSNLSSYITTNVNKASYIHIPMNSIYNQHLDSLVEGDTLLLNIDDSDEIIMHDLSISIPIENRFISINNDKRLLRSNNNIHNNSLIYNNRKLNNNNNNNNNNEEECVKVMGSIGGIWPTPQRGHWFRNKGDIDSFRDKLRALCPLDKNKIRQYIKKTKFKMIIYQRDISRKLYNQEEAINMIFNKLDKNDWQIEVIMHERDRPPCVLSHMLNYVDVLLTPHGFQSMLLLFLPRPSLLFEVFPYKYYKRGYGPFGGEYGIQHAGVMSPPLTWYGNTILKLLTTNYCMNSKMCRSWARDSDVLLTQHGVNRLVESINKLIIKLNNPIVIYNSIDNYNNTKYIKRDYIY